MNNADASRRINKVNFYWLCDEDSRANIIIARGKWIVDFNFDGRMLDCKGDNCYSDTEKYIEDYNWKSVSVGCYFITIRLVYQMKPLTLWGILEFLHYFLEI